MAKMTVAELALDLQQAKKTFLEVNHELNRLKAEVEALKSALATVQAQAQVPAPAPAPAQAQTPTQANPVLSAIRALSMAGDTSPARRQFLAGRVILAAGWEGALPPDRLGQVIKDAALLVKKAGIEENLQPRAAAKLAALAKSLQ